MKDFERKPTRSSRPGMVNRYLETTREARDRHARRVVAPHLQALDDKTLESIGYTRTMLKSCL